MSLDKKPVRRRDLLRASAGAAVVSAWGRFLWAGDRPEVTHPRATSGDTLVEPDWDQRLIITVGPTQTVGTRKPDLVGTGEKVIQAAVDYIARHRGGTVHILPGTYRMRNAIYVPTGVRVCGSGTDSVLMKEPSTKTTLAADSDWYDQEITLADASGFQVGDGVFLETKNPNHEGKDVVKRTLVARSGNRFKLDRAVRDDFWVRGGATVSTLFPLLTAENATDVVIENITLDGNRANNAHINGNYAGAIWVQDCSRFTFRGITARNYNGDGISWQICHDAIMENCHCHDNAGLGAHPGSGSQRPLIRNNRLERNGLGLFVCWGVKYGLIEKNTIEENRIGISIGHRDDHNLIQNNDIIRSTETGIVFRSGRGKGYTASDNRIENNRVIDSGPEDGIAVNVSGFTHSNTIAKNEIRETRGPASHIGIRLGPKTREIKLIDNKIEGFAIPIQDLGKS